jgi:hypothetical protein
MMVQRPTNPGLDQTTDQQAAMVRSVRRRILPMNAPELPIAHVEKWKRPYGVVGQWDAYVLVEDEFGPLATLRERVRHPPRAREQPLPLGRKGCLCLLACARSAATRFGDRRGPSVETIRKDLR